MAGKNADISVLPPRNAGSRDFAHQRGTKAPEGATVGAGSGAVIGGVLGWLAGIGALAVPGVGPFLAAGPITAALAGVGAGATLGGIAGALIGLAMPQYEAERDVGRMRNGGILLSVHADDPDWTRKGKQILEQTGALDIASAGETKWDYGNSNRPPSLNGREPQVEAQPGVDLALAVDPFVEEVKR
jgi:hypothetical protein